MRERRLSSASHRLLARGLLLAGALGLVACGPSVRNFGSGSSGSGGGGGGSGVGEGGAGGGVDLGKGPKLVRSEPGNGDTQASIRQYFVLFFDRPVSSVNATGKIKVASDAHPDPAFVQVGPCPEPDNNDPTCIAGAYPDALLAPAGMNGKLLPPSTKITITIDKSFKDTDGNTNNLDTTLIFTTFKYNLNAIDDSKLIPDEAGGLDYDPKSQALFLCGVAMAGGLTVRKISVLPGDPSSGPVTFYQQPSVPGGPYCYGLDIAEGRAYVSATYGSQVWILDGLGATGTKPSQVLSATTLAAPNNMLDQVKSVAAFAGGSSLFFGFGRYLGNGTAVTGVLSYRASPALWSVALPLDNPSQGFTVAPSVTAKGIFLYVALNDRIIKVDQTANIVNTFMYPSGAFIYEPQLRVDSQGRLYLGDTNGGLVVYDTEGSQGFKPLARRAGLPTGRFGIRENDKDVDVFFIPFRGKAVIGTTTISF